ncbi:hypothetical protein BC332_13645 [Capsicum chinense]|nr:hypothetical protein BC332_13645 [Capsicum chinense]
MLQVQFGPISRGEYKNLCANLVLYYVRSKIYTNTSNVSHCIYFPPSLPALAARLPTTQKSKIHVGMLAKIIDGSVFISLLIIGILYKRGCLAKKAADGELKGLELQAGLFTLRQIKAAIKNFDPTNKIGEGGFGLVYKDVMEDPCIAVDGYIYEGDAIKGWLYSGHDTSPMTNLNLDTWDLIPNYAIYHII